MAVPIKLRWVRTRHFRNVNKYRVLNADFIHESL